MSYHLTYTVIIIAFTAYLIGNTIVNLYYFQNIYTSGGTPHIGKTSAGVVMFFNILALILEFVVLVWSVMRIFNEQTKDMPGHKGHPIFDIPMI